MYICKKKAGYLHLLLRNLLGNLLPNWVIDRIMHYFPAKKQGLLLGLKGEGKRSSNAAGKWALNKITTPVRNTLLNSIVTLSITAQSTTFSQFDIF